MALNSIYITLRVAVICIVFAFLVFTALESRYRYSKPRTGALVLLLVVITVVITILFLTEAQFLSDHSTFGILLWLISALTIFHITIKGSSLEILYIVFVVLNVYVNIMAIAKIIIGVLPSVPSSPCLYSAISLGVLMLYIPLLWILFCKLYKTVIEFNIYLYFWKFLWIIPALCYLIFYVKIVDDYWKKPVQPNSYDVVFIVLWSFATYILFCGTLMMLIQAYRGITAAKETQLVKSQLRIQEKQYKKLLNNMDKTARFQHDWRHHLMTINGLAEKAETEELKTYIQNLFPQYITEQETALCENHVVNIILQHYASVAASNKITTEISVNIPSETHVTDIDLCVIFGNLIENAMDACQGQDSDRKYIEIISRTIGRQLAITMQNTYQNKLLVKDGVYFSTKHDGPGIGLPSIKQVVEKYGGMIKIESDTNYFCVNLLL